MKTSSRNVLLALFCAFSALNAAQEANNYAIELAADKKANDSTWRNIIRYRDVNPAMQISLTKLVHELEQKMSMSPVSVSIMEDNTMNRAICYCLGPCMTANACAFELAGFFRSISIGEELINGCTHDELKGVIAHELAHIKCNHVSKRVLAAITILLITKSVITLCNEATDNDYTEVFEKCLLGILVPISLAYISRLQEAEADAVAAQYLENPLAISDALKKLTLWSASKDRLLGSHPGLKTREDALRAVVEAREKTAEQKIIAK